MRRRRFRFLAVPSVFLALGLLATLNLIQSPREVGAAGAVDGEKSQSTAAGASDQDDQGVRKAGAGYMAALNKGDLEGILAFWAPDADYVDEAGKMTRGREAIATLYKKSLAENNGAKYKGQTYSIKFLRPDVAMVDGSVEITSSEGVRDSNRYAVVWTRSGDKWLISSARDLPTEIDDLPSLAYAQLKGLEWLVGEWTDRSDKIDATVSCRWAPNKSFLLIEYRVKQENQDPLLVSVRVGWDAHNQMIRSWTFDSKGGFGEGYWQHQGHRWVVGASGILPDGGTGAATYVYEFVNPDTFIWHAKDRDVDGQPLADSDVKFVRKAVQEGGAK
jgi:uncharacterized protein (TIGR02246 family)